jgi:hypothetical protein
VQLDGLVADVRRAVDRGLLRQAGLGAQVWDTLQAWSLDRVLDHYPAGIDGVLGVRALGCRRVAFDFERQQFGCGR